jgi:hypothetical protein
MSRYVVARCVRSIAHCEKEDELRASMRVLAVTARFHAGAALAQQRRINEQDRQRGAEQRSTPRQRGERPRLSQFDRARMSFGTLRRVDFGSAGAALGAE